MRVTGATVLLVGASGTINSNGGNFRRDATVICDGFTVTNYVNRGWNINSAVIQATNLIGIHDVVVKHLTLDSGDTGKQKFTVLGAAVIDTVSPKAKRGFTTTITVTGEGFALLSQFAANDSNIIMYLASVTNRFLVTVDVLVDSSVNSGLYNLVCTNSFSGLGSFTSGTSGNNKLQVFGDPLVSPRITTNYYVDDIEIGKTKDVSILGFDLTDEITTNPSGLTINSVSGSNTNKTVNITGSSNIADIGVKDVFVNDSVNGGNSGTSGNGLLALNYAYEPTVIRVPTVFRAYGGAVLSDWVITQNANSVTVERIGGTGMAYLEATDIFFVASLLAPFTLGNINSYLYFSVETPAANLPDGFYGTAIIVGIGARGVDNTAVFDTSWRIWSNSATTYQMRFDSSSFNFVTTSAANMGFRMQAQNYAQRTDFIPKVNIYL